MSGIINLIILYVVFTSISSFVNRTKKAQQQQAALKKTGQAPPVAQDQKKPPSLGDIFFPPQQQPPPPMENILDLEDDEIAFNAEEVSEEVSVELPPLPKRPVAKRMKSQRSASLLKYGKNGYLKGVILSEILGPPVSQRKSRRTTN